MMTRISNRRPHISAQRGARVGGFEWSASDYLTVVALVLVPIALTAYATGRSGFRWGR